VKVSFLTFISKCPPCFSTIRRARERNRRRALSGLLTLLIIKTVLSVWFPDPAKVIGVVRRRHDEKMQIWNIQSGKGQRKRPGGH
jgi:hypothetical protein